MLKDVSVAPRDFQEYRVVIDYKLFEEIIYLSGQLRNKRILYINSNQNRGGVYEHLTSLIPLLQNLGIKAEWKAISEVPPDFYEATKRIYNCIQGAEYVLTPKQWKIYENFNKGIAKEVEGDNWDFVLVQDHQMLGALSQVRNKRRMKWIWQSHSETHNPDERFVNHLIKYLQPYDGVILYLPEYVFKNFHPKKLVTSTIAIDPISPKNVPMNKLKARRVIEQFGINSHRPFITQIARIDSWKDFPGVVDAWLIAKKKIPGLQLAIVGVVSLNNIHAKEIIDQILEKTKGEEGIYLLINTVERENIKAFQTASNIIVQKSLREGFGLAVSEALWSGTPVIGGNVGGIKVQIINGKCGYLVDSIEECAQRIIELIQNPSRARAMGKFGREYVRKQFLLPRLIRDEMQLMIDLLD
ncbi:MAG: glycosyltransferase [Candidatus Levybacteria bacterium]|nr:glycosyltransferase [Candidatus Levybacteria bacterium]